MRQDRIRTAFFASFLVTATGLIAAPALAQTPYDGLWQVTVVTKSGSCEPQTSSTLTVADGKVSAAGADVSGSVGREGLVRVSIHGAYANGQLSGNAGSGKWNGASAGVPCSGRWEASRQ
jgi:type 1 fimbria pilin